MNYGKMLVREQSAARPGMGNPYGLGAVRIMDAPGFSTVSVPVPGYTDQLPPDPNAGPSAAERTPMSQPPAPPSPTPVTDAATTIGVIVLLTFAVLFATGFKAKTR